MFGIEGRYIRWYSAVYVSNMLQRTPIPEDRLGEDVQCACVVTCSLLMRVEVKGGATKKPSRKIRKSRIWGLFPPCVSLGAELKDGQTW